MLSFLHHCFLLSHSLPFLLCSLSPSLPFPRPPPSLAHIPSLPLSSFPHSSSPPSLPLSSFPHSPSPPSSLSHSPSPPSLTPPLLRPHSPPSLNPCPHSPSPPSLNLFPRSLPPLLPLSSFL